MRRGISIVYLLPIVALTVLIPSALKYGLQIRHDGWYQTNDMRFTGDVSNGFYWGQHAVEEGLFNVYDNLIRSEGDDGNYVLDYAPLRLTVVRNWVEWSRAKYPRLTTWRNNYDQTYYMLRLNTSAELVSCVLIFLLIVFWRWRMNRAGVLLGLIGAYAFWFNPAVIFDSHCWPQWDIWLVPFFLAAILLAGFNFWFLAGLSIVVATFLKGQVLLVAPIFIIWPIVQGRWQAALGFLAGFVLGAALIALPWMRSFGPSDHFLVRSGIAIAILTVVSFIRLIPWRWIPSVAVVCCILAWPRGAFGGWEARRWVILIFAVLAFSRFIPWRPRIALGAIAFAACIFLLMPLFDLSSSWFTVGFEFGSRKFNNLTDLGDYTLLHILESNYRYAPDLSDAVGIHFGHAIFQITFRALMLDVYVLILIACSIGAAIQFRRRDVRFLAAMVAPWFCFFLLLTQMNCRYLIWGAALAPLLAGVDIGALLIGLLASVACWCQMAERMLDNVSYTNYKLFTMLTRFDPDLGWTLMLIAAIYLYLALVPTRKRSAIQNSAPVC